MSFWRPEKRDIPASAPLRAWAAGDVDLGASGINGALRLVPVYAAVSLIADSVSIMPAHVYELGPGGRKVVVDQQPMIVTAPHPNPLFTRIEWVQQYCVSLLLRGNAYGYTIQDEGGFPGKVAWLNPDEVRVDEKVDGLPKYFHREKPLDPGRLIHIPWFPKPGSVVGLSPIGQFKEQFERGTLANNYGRNWFRSSGVPKGHLKFGAGPLDNEQAAIAKDRFKAAVSGGDIFVSGNDWEWKGLAVAPNEAQFLETIQAGATEIAAIFKVSPEDIGGSSGNSLTYSTLELNQLKLQVRALQPVFTRLEQHVTRVLPDNRYFKFNPDAIVRTDIKARMEAHEIALRTGMETQDEGRALEDRAPLTKKQREDWQSNYGGKGGANGANPNGNPSGQQSPMANKGGAGNA